MTRIRFEDLPSTNTPRTAENLNKLNNVEISPTEPTTGEEVWIQKSKNLFDKNTVIKGYVYGGNGTLTANALWNASEFIKVNPNTPYTVQSTQISGKTEKQMTLSYWDINRTWIGEKYTTNLVETITTPNNCAYITVSHRNDTQENIQLEQGSTATSYEPYIDKKIFVKNDNDVYEEIYDEENSKRKILWTNPNPTSSFGGQTITTSKDYTMYSVVYAVKISGYYYYMSTGILPYDLRASLQSVGEGAMRRRNIESISLGSFAFNVCKELNNNIEDNADCIPAQIIGYN